jgi:hypothetical protein
MISPFVFNYDDMIHMLSVKYMLDSFKGFDIGKNHQNLPGYVKFLFGEMDEIKHKLPKFYDPTACLLAVSRPLVEMTLCNCGLSDKFIQSKMVGRTPLSNVTLMQIHILATIKPIGSYRQVERTINSYPSWLHALQLSKAPHHSTLGKFRKNLGESFFSTFFNELLKIIIDAGIINTEQNALNIDSAPFNACMNFARANSGVKLDCVRLKEFFNYIDFSPVLTGPSIENTGKKRMYTNEMLLKFILYEQLGGFLSRSQALRHLKKHPKVAQIIGFPFGKIPTAPTISNFSKQFTDITTLIIPLRDQIVSFFSDENATLNFEQFPTFFLEDFD